MTSDERYILEKLARIAPMFHPAARDLIVASFTAPGHKPVNLTLGDCQDAAAMLDDQEAPAQ